ncbi:MAG: hypothetical protein ACOYOA_15105, partial [Saprospiraceae bacterium]
LGLASSMPTFFIEFLPLFLSFAKKREVNNVRKPSFEALQLSGKLLLCYYVNRNSDVHFVYSIRIISNDGLKKVIAEKDLLAYYFFEDTLSSEVELMLSEVLKKRNADGNLGFDDNDLEHFAKELQRTGEPIHFVINEHCAWPEPNAAA